MNRNIKRTKVASRAASRDGAAGRPIRPIRPTPSWPAATAEALIRLWNIGLSAAQVGARLGATTRAVESKVRKLRVAGYPLASRRPKPPPRLRRARRKCLYCGQGFASSHVGNRICPTCIEAGPFSSAMV